jgi:glycerophosphoryl diester phosphodiesterase
MPLVIAHRGAHDAAPENTVAAFERAIALGVDLIELDVRRSGDGQLVVYHDAEVDGTAVSALRADDVRAKGGGETPAPRLAQVLALAYGRVALDIEVKEPGCVGEVVGKLIPFGLERCLLTSFHPDIVLEAKQLVTGLRTGLIVDGRSRGASGEALELAQCARADYVALEQSHADPELFAHARAAGIGCLVWTVNDPVAIDRYLTQPAVGGLITDRPELALARRAALTGRRAD